MSMKTIFSYVYILLCTTAAIFMLVYWGREFSLDEDLTVTTYRKFYERGDDVYPTVSICLVNSFLKQRLADYGVNQSLYLKFLKGEYFSEDMLKIDYKNVSIDISDYVKGYKVYFRNGTREMDIMDKTRLTYNSYNGFDTYGKRFMKCFAVNIPRVQDLKTFRILISNELFEPTRYERPTNQGFSAFFEIPQQHLLSGDFKKIDWPFRAANESYKMRFKLSDITIMRKRNKRKSRCIMSDKGYDHWVMKLHKNEIQCNVPYLNLNQKLPVCNNKELMKRGLARLRMLTENRLKPCKTMENIDMEFIENTMATSRSTNGNHLGEFLMSITYKTANFKEYQQKRYSISL